MSSKFEGDLLARLIMTLITNYYQLYNMLYTFTGKTTQLLASVFAGCCFVGVAVTATFMTRIRLFVYASASEKRKSDSARSFAAVRDAFRNTKLQLIAPLSLFIGLEQGFIYSDFSKVSTPV